MTIGDTATTHESPRHERPVSCTSPTADAVAATATVPPVERTRNSATLLPMVKMMVLPLSANE
jgi:hypothetical protein